MFFPNIYDPMLNPVEETQVQLFEYIGSENISEKPKDSSLSEEFDNSFDFFTATDPELGAEFDKIVQDLQLAPLSLDLTSEKYF